MKRAVHVWHGGCMWQVGVHAWQGACVTLGMHAREMATGSGQYASYWNALFFHRFVQFDTG